MRPARLQAVAAQQCMASWAGAGCLSHLCLLAVPVSLALHCVCSQGPGGAHKAQQGGLTINLTPKQGTAGIELQQQHISTDTATLLLALLQVRMQHLSKPHWHERCDCCFACWLPCSCGLQHHSTPGQPVHCLVALPLHTPSHAPTTPHLRLDRISCTNGKLD